MLLHVRVYTLGLCRICAYALQCVHAIDKNHTFDLINAKMVVNCDDFHSGNAIESSFINSHRNFIHFHSFVGLEDPDITQFEQKHKRIQTVMSTVMKTHCEQTQKHEKLNAKDGNVKIRYKGTKYG